MTGEGIVVKTCGDTATVKIKRSSAYGHDCGECNLCKNPDGTPGMQQTLQGHTDTSCWSRGQGWGTTGFAWAYRFTKDESFLEISKKW